MPLIDDTTILATGSTTRRSIKTRLAEQVTNVRDFGAVGDGSTNDRAAIQAAINAASHSGLMSGGVNHRVIFFPEGDYIIDAPLVYGPETHNSIIFRGVGAGSRIRGSFVGFLLERDPATSPGLDNSNPGLCLIENLWFFNASITIPSGCIRWSYGYTITVRNCLLSGCQGFTGTSTFGVEILNCDFVIASGGIILGSFGIGGEYGGPAHISGCQFMGLHHGILGGGAIHGCRFENNGNGVTVGVDQYGGTTSTSGVAISSCSFEGNDCGIYARNMLSSTIQACGIHGHNGAPYSGYGAGQTTGVIPGDLGGCSTYGIWVENGWNNVWSALRVFDMFNGAAIHIVEGNIVSPAELVGSQIWIGVIAANDHVTDVPFTGSTIGWEIGGTGHKGQHFIRCVPALDPVMVFADLPTTANLGRAKGVKYCITNGGAQAIGAPVTGSGDLGSTFMEVMWNGSNWTRCA